MCVSSVNPDPFRPCALHWQFKQIDPSYLPVELIKRHLPMTSFSKITSNLTAFPPLAAEYFLPLRERAHKPYDAAADYSLMCVQKQRMR